MPAAMPGLASYGASKLAAAKVMEYLALENPNVRVMTVHPGVIDTPMNRKSVEAGLILPFDDGEFLERVDLCCLADMI